MKKENIIHIVFSLSVIVFLLAILICANMGDPYFSFNGISLKKTGSFAGGLAAGIFIYSLLRSGFQSLIINISIFLVSAITIFGVNSCTSLLSKIISGNTEQKVDIWAEAIVILGIFMIMVAINTVIVRLAIAICNRLSKRQTQ